MEPGTGLKYLSLLTRCIDVCRFCNLSEIYRLNRCSKHGRTDDAEIIEDMPFKPVWNLEYTMKFSLPMIHLLQVEYDGVFHSADTEEAC
jgi:hypothetical protein